MGKGLPPQSPSSDIEAGTNNYKPHHRRRPPPPPKFSPPAPEPWFAWLLPLVFVANIVMFVVTMYINDCPATTGPENCLFYDYLGRFSFQSFKDNPLLGPSLITLKELGALDWKLVVESNQAWRLISCIWLHAGVIHLLANMMSLLFIGIRMEQEFGFLRIGLLYMLSGFGGSLRSAVTPGRRQTISVGASGALFGLLGAMLSELITNWTNYTNKCQSLSTMLLIISLNLAVGFLPHVDNSAHIGGFISGFLAGFILLMRPQFGYVSHKHIPPGYEIKRKIPRHKCYQYLLLVIALVLLLVGYAIGLSRLFEGQTL
ncbi:RHOMBOID-like protein 5 [Durio zibethinus]|uniref:RHOMBOID-like protein n=1 Tax=Durio zibethinus TaxID=66656 RepID=A0A6P5WYI5_DURZI|nr:RHOMBOID-like protein 5 [Durio zibethinus]